jgi:hypothetical protein
METKEILKILPTLTNSDRLTIAEMALQLIQQEHNSLTQEQAKRQLAAAALSAISDYAPDSELLVFKGLEGEDFYDEPDELMENL